MCDNQIGNNKGNELVLENLGLCSVHGDNFSWIEIATHDGIKYKSSAVHWRHATYVVLLRRYAPVYSLYTLVCVGKCGKWQVAALFFSSPFGITKAHGYCRHWLLCLLGWYVWTYMCIYVCEWVSLSECEWVLFLLPIIFAMTRDDWQNYCHCCCCCCWCNNSGELFLS